MKRRIGIALALALAVAPSGSAQEAAPRDYANSFGELYWVPTYDQALRMAEATGRPLFLMGYSLVGDGSTYTKTSDEECRSVF